MLNVSRWLCANRIMIVTHSEKMILVSLIILGIASIALPGKFLRTKSETRH